MLSSSVKHFEMRVVFKNVCIFKSLCTFSYTVKSSKSILYHHCFRFLFINFEWGISAVLFLMVLKFPPIQTV